MASKILLVDDEMLVIKSLDRLLKKAGYEVVTVTDATAALKEVKRSDFDLIISDIRMPGKDGVNLIREIRSLLQSEKRQRIPEIFMTGYASEEVGKEAEKLKVAEYIYKPFDLSQFLNLVRKHVKK
ncbi:MAG: response regulator [Candidatus Omnitrophica bacterium CG11_big_fil_rev_8_21_14_0_20_45_26]|uniref:Response regulator n=1 Tax=Candidatus Abzuiibacterium crystallinum TaxID=1974748 RepID=A0A2H0LSZ7_9BACT|nr:MAG: response regulator [Candidatus Omnitrophica bacterium CG11_big_fil_rev_8_21_14_0_20_45_26]PIW64618.1 MAG: response regulator [Candidatus Omnitrophica bacterium CG12_big_fil_rev_8_21_14_0_65_45_16]